MFNIVYYLFNFSKWGAIPLILTLLYYFLRVNNQEKAEVEEAAEEATATEAAIETAEEATTEAVVEAGAAEEVIAEEKRAEHTLSEWIGVYLGALIIDIFFIRMCYEGIIPSVPNILSSNNFIHVIIILIVELIVLLNLNKPNSGKYGVCVFLKYIILFGTTVGCSYNFIRWSEASVVFALISVFLVSLAVELFVNSFNARQKCAIFSWTMTLCILFNLANWLYPDFSISLVRWICNISLRLQYRWYIAIIPIILSILGIILSIILRQTGEAKASDTKLYILSLFVTIFFWIITSFVTKYNIVFILIYSIANCIFLASGKNDKSVNVLGIDLSRSNIYCVIVMSLTSGLPISFYLGTVLQYSVIACIVLFIALQYGNYKSKSKKTEGQEEEVGTPDRPHQKWFFWQVLITLFAVYAIVIVTVTNRFMGNYIFIAALYLLATMANIIISIQNTMLPKNHSVARVFIAIPVIAVFFFCTERSAISIDYNVDNKISSSEGLSNESVQESGDILLSIDIEKEGVEIKKAYYYWFQDNTKLTKLKVGENQMNVIEPKNDCLFIVCETEDGVVFTDKHWFFSSELENYIEVVQ